MSSEVSLVAVEKNDCQELQRNLIAIEGQKRTIAREDQRRTIAREVQGGTNSGAVMKVVVRMIATQQPGKGWISECQRKQRPNSQSMTGGYNLMPLSAIYPNQGPRIWLLNAISVSQVYKSTLCWF
jgi:hypothetical protein